MRKPLGLSPVRRVEVVAFLEHFEREVGEHASEALGDPRVMVGIAEAAEREIDGTLEPAKRVEVKL